VASARTATGSPRKIRVLKRIPNNHRRGKEGSKKKNERRIERKLPGSRKNMIRGGASPRGSDAQDDVFE